jgi:acetyl esterase/lipase
MIDPELSGILELLPQIDLSDPVAARAGFAELVAGMASDIAGIESLDVEDRLVPGWEGDPDVGVRIYRPKNRSGPVPGVLMIHGGGFIIGSVEAEHASAASTAIQTGAVVVSVEYRLAPEHPFPAGLHDCYSALVFLAGAAGELGVDTTPAPEVDWPRRRHCWPVISAPPRSASRCSTSPSSTTAWRRRRCAPSSTRRSGTAPWPT